MFALKRIGRLGIIAAIATSAVAAVACGDDDDYGDSAATPVAASTRVSPSSSPTAAATAAATPAATGTTVQVAQSSLGAILTDDAGLTLYTNKNDVAGGGTSVCGEGCAAAWPALTVAGEPTKAAEVPGELGTITRTDGATQVTYKGLPLYHFVNDKMPGDTMGQGVLNLWFVAQP